MAETVLIAVFAIATFSAIQGLLGAVCLREAVSICASEWVSFKRSYLLNVLIWAVVVSVGVISVNVAHAYGTDDSFGAILLSAFIFCFAMHVVVTRFCIDLSLLQSIGSTLLVGLFTGIVWGTVAFITGAMMRLT